MPRTIQCPTCGIVLNLPDQAIGKRLKCPKCATKFATSQGDARSPASTYLLPNTKPPSSQGEMDAGGASDEAMPKAEGDLRETFDLPMLEEIDVGLRTAPASKQTGDALALFDQDPRGSPRRQNAAEARSKARRCPTCSGVVPIGMSICSRCGLDLESGTRVDLEDDLGPPPAPPEPAMPMPIGILGGICFFGSVIFTIATASLWLRGQDGFQYFVPLCLFGVFASVQFLRRKSVKLLMIALTFGLAINIIALIILPIVHASSEIKVIEKPGFSEDPELAEVAIPSIVDHLDLQSLKLGIAVIVIYGVVSVYLLSPQVRRYFRVH
jgi:hypothetical protein